MSDDASEPEVDSASTQTGSTDLDYLLREARPELDPDEYVFVCVEGEYGDFADLEPLASFRESEGLTLVLRRLAAEEGGIDFAGSYRRITFRVHSSLDAVGLTAAFSARLTAHGISANVIAAFYHDHVFVAAADGERALQSLQSLDSY